MQIYTKIGNKQTKMGNILDKVAVLDRIKEFYSLKGNADLARFLGVAPNTVTNWYNRKTFDIDAIFTKCVDINLTWLFLGKGHKKVQDEAPPPKEQQNDKINLYYNMYKEQQKEIRSLLEEIGVLKERLRQYQSQIETFQDLPSIRSDSANNTGNQKKYISKKDVTAPNATKELVKNASKHDSKISAATSVAVNSTKQQSGTKKKV